MAPMKPEPPHRDRHLADTLSLGQLARRWNTSRKQVRGLLARQELDFVQIGGRFRVPLAEVERYENARRPG